jgi:hypothetical protein
VLQKGEHSNSRRFASHIPSRWLAPATGRRNRERKVPRCGLPPPAQRRGHLLLPVARTSRIQSWGGRRVLHSVITRHGRGTSVELMSASRSKGGTRSAPLGKEEEEEQAVVRRRGGCLPKVNACHWSPEPAARRCSALHPSPYLHRPSPPRLTRC